MTITNIAFMLFGAAMLALGFGSGFLWDVLKEHRRKKVCADFNPNMFPVPDITNEAKPYKMSRGITCNNGVLTFTWESEKCSSTREVKYKNSNQAIANYEREFLREERLFVERNKEMLKESQTNSDRITSLSTEVSSLRGELTTLKESLGE